MQVLFLPGRPKLIGNVLNMSPMFSIFILDLENSPGGGETTFDFMVRMFTVDKGCRLIGSLRTSMVRALEFKMPSTSVITANKDLSSRLSPCVFNSEPRLALAE